MRSTKTTVAAILAAVAIAAKATADILADGSQAGDFALIVAAIATAAIGLFARDDNVTSEGTRAPKTYVRRR